MYYVIYMYFKLSSGLLQVQPIHMYKEFHFILKFEKWNDDNANRSIVSILLPLSLPRELSVKIIYIDIHETQTPIVCDCTLVP